jgi:hypothetical protein
MPHLWQVLSLSLTLLLNSLLMVFDNVMPPRAAASSACYYVYDNGRLSKHSNISSLRC